MSQQTLAVPLPLSPSDNRRSTKTIIIPDDDFINEEKLKARLDCIFDGRVKEFYWVTGHWVVEGTGLTELNSVRNA